MQITASSMLYTINNFIKCLLYEYSCTNSMSVLNAFAIAKQRSQMNKRCVCCVLIFYQMHHSFKLEMQRKQKQILPISQKQKKIISSLNQEIVFNWEDEAISHLFGLVKILVSHISRPFGLVKTLVSHIRKLWFLI